MNMTEFRAHQQDLRRRADRQRQRSVIRARLERQLRDLVVEELRRETSATPPPPGEWLEDDDHQLTWFQK